MKKLALLFGLLFAFPAFAADNAVIVTPGTGVTMRSKDIGAGVQSMIHMLGDAAGASIYGTAGTANTNILTVQGIASMTPLLATVTGTVAATQSGAWNITNVSGTVSLPTGASTSANQTSELTKLDTIITNTGAAIPAGTAIIGKVGIDQTTPGTTNLVAAGQNGTWTVQPGNTANTTPWLVTQSGQYPSGATAITASATGTTGATTATLAGTSGKTTYICGYSIRANATAATTVTNTITGVITATLSSVMWVAPLASGLGVDEQIFSPCIPASATNTGIAIVSGAPGSGGTVSSKGWGYQL